MVQWMPSTTQKDNLMAVQLQQSWTMQSSDICVVGEELGIDWNTVWQDIQDKEFHGQDGDRSVYVEREELQDWNDGLLKTIFNHIFATHPHVNAIFTHPHVH